jgi:HK97 family phage portal protein
MKTSTGKYVSERLSLSLPVVYACVSLRADMTAMLPARVVIRRGNTTTEVEGDPRAAMLNDRPNEAMTAFGCRQAIDATTLLWGDGMGEIIRDNAGRGVGLWPIPAGCVRPEIDRTQGEPHLRYRGSIGTIPFDAPASEVLHMRTMTLDGITGLSPVAEARQAVGLGLAMEEFGAKLFGNEAKSGGFVSHPSTLGTVALENLRESLNARGGLDNAHSIRVLEEGMTYQASTIPPEDAQFLGSREFEIAEIARMYRVPLELLQSQGKTSSWGSGIEQLFLAFATWTIGPHAKQWGQEMTSKLLTPAERARGMRIELDWRFLTQGDSQARAAYIDRLIRASVLSPNEGREMEGRNPRPGGNDYAMLPTTGGAVISTPESEQERDRERKEQPE